MSDSINSVQETMFNLMTAATFNDYDGDAVVEMLKANRNLWKGVVMGRWDLIPLRDIGDGYWNVDTIYALAVDNEAAEQLVLLFKGLKADEVDRLSGRGENENLGTYPFNHTNVVRAWWD